MAKQTSYSWAENTYYRKDRRGRVTALKRPPRQKGFSKIIIENAPLWIERPKVTYSKSKKK